MRTAVLPTMTAADGSPLRIWSAGCASGEEPYSMAMLLAEVLGREQYQNRVKIYATDVDDLALNEARAGSYSAKQIEQVPAALRERYFTAEGNRFVFDKELRRAVIFGRHDLIQDAPISRVNVLMCRNTLMYFNNEAQSAHPRPVPLRARPQRRPLPGKVGDAVDAGTPVRAVGAQTTVSSGKSRTTTGASAWRS